MNIKLKIIAMSASGKSALCAAQLTAGVFTTELAVGNVRVSEALEVGSIHETPFTKCDTKVTTSEENGKEFTWLVLS